MASGRTIASIPGIGIRSDRRDRDELSSSVPRKRRRAFERIYARHHQELYRYCFSILRSREDAEDALQATMAAALRALPGEKREIALRPWLFRVAHNEAISLVRTRRPAVELHEESGPAAPSAEATHAERDRRSRLVDDLRSLPERQSAAIVMRELSGLSYEEIGAALSSSEAAARQAVYEGRVALRTQEEGREMECESVRRALSDCDGRALKARKLKAHLDGCDGCRGFAASMERRRADLAMLCPPIPALAATGILGGLLGGSHGSVAAAGAAGASAGAAGSGGLGAIGGGLAGSAALKGASLAAAVAIAAGAADVGGAIDLTHPFGGGSDAARHDDRAPAGGTESSPVVTHEVAALLGLAGAEGRAAAGHPSGRSDQAPGTRGETPGQAGTAPGRSGSTPANPSETPGQADGTPGASGEAPGAATAGNGSGNGAGGSSGSSNAGGSSTGSDASAAGAGNAAEPVPIEPPTPAPAADPPTPAVPAEPGSGGATPAAGNGRAG
jgi:RNA polymerase sigma factor (sigma-70 family)